LDTGVGTTVSIQFKMLWLYYLPVGQEVMQLEVEAFYAAIRR
jgi:hypothetical protein